MGGARALMVARSDDGGHNMALRPQVYHHRCVATPLDVLALIVLAAPGDAAVGKSSLLVRLTDQRFMTNPDPTVRAHAPGSRILTTDLYAARCRVRLQVDRDTRTRQDRQTPMSVPSQRTPSAHLGRFQVGIRPGPNPFARSRARITVVLRGVCSSMT